METLTAREYENLLKFTHYINEDYGNFIPNVLYGLEEICGWPLSVYTIFSEDKILKESIVDMIQGNNIYSRRLEEYRQDMFKTDLFFQRAQHDQQGKNQEYVLTITDVSTYEEFYDTDYGRYLLNINTPYQAVMRSRNVDLPLHVLNAFKTAEQGDFTSHERMYLSHISRSFSKAVALYKQHIAQTAYRRFLDIETQDKGRGIAIIDSNNNIAYQNGSFLSTITLLLGARGIFAAIKALYGAFEKQTGFQPQAMTQSARTTLNGYRIQISPQFIDNGEMYEKYLFVTVDQREGSGSSFFQGGAPAPREYGLTEREEEVAALMAQGMDNAQIADALCISVTTVKYHIKNIYAKVGTNRRTGAIAKLLGQ